VGTGRRKDGAGSSCGPPQARAVAITDEGIEAMKKRQKQLAPVNPLARTHPLCELPVKVRLEGLPADVETLAHLLRETGCVVEESPDYPNRGASKFVRRYVTVKL